MTERRLTLAVSLLFAGSLLASCGGNSISYIEDRDAGTDDRATGGDAGSSSGTSGGGTSGNSPTSGGASSGGVGAAAGASGGAAGSVQGGTGGESGRGGEGGLVCPDWPPGGTPCGGNLVGTWIVAACFQAIVGVVDLAGIGLSKECMSPAANGSVQVSGSVTFDEMTYSDDTTTSGEVTFELPSWCREISGVEVTCDVLEAPLRALGFESVTCILNDINLGCSCSGTIRQTGGLAFISYDASTSGTYTTEGNQLTLSAFGVDTEYSYCLSQDTELASLKPAAAAKTGWVIDPVVLVKR